MSYALYALGLLGMIGAAFLEWRSPSQLGWVIIGEAMGCAVVLFAFGRLLQLAAKIERHLRRREPEGD